MSDMNGNPYFEDGERYATEASSLHDWPITERGIIAANAQALATLALAYEQRTANLIALWVVPESFDAQLTKPEWADVKHQIKTRLGLIEGATK